jgi:lipoprotein-anchoring transpeptidase ErfK/SrfK
MKKYFNALCILMLLYFNTACSGNKNKRLGENLEAELQVIKVAYTVISKQSDSVTIKETLKANCTQIQCAVWANVNLTEQQMYLYENGNIVGTYKVSSGDRKHKTPIMDRRFGGRMYLKYTSKKFPGGNYMGLGNMPYVVFIKGGYAIHGTTPGSFKKLGKVASHGCIRLHPDNAKIFYDLIKKYGASNTWITVQY